MRVVLYYDLLRFSPCSIDLFRNEHFSPLHERLLPPLILHRCNAAVVSHTTNHNNTTRHCGVKGSLLSQRCESERRFVFSRSRTYWCVCWQCGPSGLCWYVVQICTSPNGYINSRGFGCLSFREKHQVQIAVLTVSVSGVCFCACGKLSSHLLFWQCRIWDRSACAEIHQVLLLL